jgi:zinc/manganese transport system substrate-binding protein/manganese/iron transport system substrate-binding protein
MTRLVAVVLALAIALAGCSGQPGGSGAGENGTTVVATTTVLADLVAKVGGDGVDVRSLVPAGGEVHTFDPSPGDVTAVAEADLIVMNGLGLDEWALELVEGSGSDAVIVELAEDLEGVEYVDAGEHEEEPGHEEGEHGHEGGDHDANPHLWLNVAYAALYVDRIAEALAQLDPELQTNATAYRAELEDLHEEIADRMAAIPEANRRIVSFHEAFPYFAAAYGLEVVGVIVDAPGQDPSAGEIAALVDAIRESGARAVFAEAQFDPRLAETVAE